MLTEFQKSRVRFHLDYVQSDVSGLYEVVQELQLDRLSDEVLLALVGPSDDPSPQMYVGQSVGSSEALLARLETAYSNLSPSVIDDSLFVSQAGSVTLRRDELQARKRLYRSLQRDLATLVDVREKVSYDIGAY